MYELGVLTMNKKRMILTINEEYIHTYGLPKVYLGKCIVVYNDRNTHFAKHAFEFSS